jgi:hypothetical protein
VWRRSLEGLDGDGACAVARRLFALDRHLGVSCFAWNSQRSALENLGSRSSQKMAVIHLVDSLHGRFRNLPRLDGTLRTNMERIS